MRLETALIDRDDVTVRDVDGSCQFDDELPQDDSDDDARLPGDGIASRRPNSGPQRPPPSGSPPCSPRGKPAHPPLLP